MKPCGGDASDVETMVMSDGVNVQELDRTPATTKSQEGLIINRNNQPPPEQTHDITFEPLHPSTTRPGSGDIGNSNQEGQATAIQVTHAWQEQSSVERLESVAEDPEACAAAVEWTAEVIDTIGAVSLDDSKEIVDILDSLTVSGSNNCDILTPTLLLSLGILLSDRAAKSGSMLDMECAIKYLTKAAEIEQGDNESQLEVSRALSRVHGERFKEIGRLEDVDLAIMHQNQVLQFVGHKQEPYAVCLGELGSLYRQRYETVGIMDDLAKAIEYQAVSLDLIAEEDQNRAAALNNLGNSYLCRFERLGELEDINRAIECQTRAVQLTPEGHAHMPSRYNNLGNSYSCRFERLGELEDINRAIECLTRAVQLTPEGHAHMPSQYNNLGTSYSCRFERLGELEDINRAIECQTRAVQLTPEGHADMPSQYNNLGNSYLCRFERLGELEDIDRAIECLTRAVQLTPEDHADMPSRYNNLGGSHTRRFERLGELEDINRAIECQTWAVQLTPEGHAHMPSQYNNLGTSYLWRFERLGELEDINRAIECQTRAVQLTPEGHTDMPSWYNNLGGSHARRFERLGELEDINRAIECQTRAVHLTPEGHTHTPSQYNNLGTSYERRFERLGELEDINRAIECLTRAVQLTPEGHADMPSRYNNLGTSYKCRFKRLGELEDINRAIECQTRAVQLTPEGHAGMPSRYSNLGTSYSCRFERLGELEDINRAIECQTRAVQLTPEGHAGMPSQYNNLGTSYSCRFERLGELEDINRAIECQTWAVQLTPEGHSDIPASYTNLGSSYSRRFNRLGELDDLKQATECSYQAVLLTPDEHADKSSRLHNYGNRLWQRYVLHKQPGDILQSIEVYTQALHLLPEGHDFASTVQAALGRSYRTSLHFSKNPEDWFSALNHLEAAACSSTGSPSVRFRASRDWADLLSMLDTSLSLKAHSTSMSLLPQVVWLGTTVGRRYESIHDIGAVAVEAAAAAVSATEYGLALEWLEEARSIVWTQMLQLRTPIAALAAADPVLAHRLQQVSVDLEQASTRVADSSPLGASTMALQADTIQHHRLADQYSALIDEARKLPGFQDFMRPRKLSDLMPAARRGVVVTVNVHTKRCDALILRPGSDEVAHVPLPNLTYNEVAQLHSLMMKTLKANNVRERAMGRLKGHPEDYYECILTALWNNLVKPILEHLGYTNKLPVDQLPHITWCTTGALSFLPIHAAGIYHSGGHRIFDYAITSYTPTLSALLASPSESHMETAGVLAVGQRYTPGFSSLPGTTEELACIKTHVDGLPFTQLEDSQATPADVLAGMGQYEYVHLACHASQDPDDPRKSCFHLHGGTLSLDQIAQKSMKNKKLAFLSACQTAAGDQKLPDEAIHLAAGMIVAGYPSVIATMWSIMDKSAPIVTDQVYSQLVKDGKLDCTQVPRALHTAVGFLRDKVGEKAFSVWAPFVHIGI